MKSLRLGCMWSETQFEAELHLPSCRRRTRELTETWIADGQRRGAGARKSECRGIRQIEGLGAELDIQPFPWTEVLEQREVQVSRFRSARHTPGGVAELRDHVPSGIPNLRGVDERRRVEIPVDRPVRKVDGNPSHAIGHIQCGVGLVTGRDASAANVGGKSAAQGENAVELPSAEEPVYRTGAIQPLLGGTERQFIPVVEVEHVRDIQRGIASLLMQVVGVDRKRGAAVLIERTVAIAVRLQIF